MAAADRAQPDGADRSLMEALHRAGVAGGLTAYPGIEHQRLAPGTAAAYLAPGDVG